MRIRRILSGLTTMACTTFALQTAHFSQAIAQVEMAITIDDVPASGSEHPSMNHQQIAEKMIKVLKKYELKKVYGFVNTVWAKPRDQRMQIFKIWKDAGFEFGNHTYSHLSLSKVYAEEFIENIEKNESVLLDIASSIDELKVFRFPFLEEGNSKEKRNLVRNYLLRRNYKIAQVTVNFDDWAFEPAYTRCAKKGDKQSLGEIKKAFLENAKVSLENATKVASKLYGEKRQIKHILLLHITSSTTDFLDELLEFYQKAGVRFVTLDEALKDPIYKEDPGYIGAGGLTFLNQLREAKGFDWPEIKDAKVPDAWLEKLCR